MPDRLSVSLSGDELRAVVSAVEDLLTRPAALMGAPTREPLHLMRAYGALVRVRHVDAGWRPGGVSLAPWAVEALSEALAPAMPAKKAPTRKPSPAARKRMSDAARKRHARARRVDVVPEPASPLAEAIVAHDDEDGGVQ